MIQVCRRKRSANRSRHRQGAILLLVAILLPVMFILSAMAINYAYIDLCETELYTATDAAARASGREFTMTRDQSQAITRGKSLAALNKVAGKGLSLNAADFIFGQSTRSSLNSRYTFNSSSNIKNSVQVSANRTSSASDGAIPLFMPNLLGRNNVEISRSAISSAIEVDIALVLDRSGSMAFAADEVAQPFVLPYSAPPGWAFCDPAPPICRWRNLDAAVAVFLNEVQLSPLDELVSLSTYNDTALTDVGLTSNYLSISAGLTPYTNSFCMGATNIGGGINEGIGALQYSPAARPHAAKVIVVMTDGIHNVGYHPIDSAYYAASQGITIFSITFANEADIYLMQHVAAIGGGKHYHANSPADLSTAFQDIAKGLPTILTK